MTRVKPEFRDQVMSMWNANKTSGQIACALGITRNAVIGIVQRFKGEKRKTTANIVSQVGRPKPRRHSKPVVPHTASADTPTSPHSSTPAPLLPRLLPPRPVVTVKTGQPCNIVDISSGCRWPIMEARHVIGGYLFCNSQCSGTSPYCADHARQAGAVYSAKLIASTIAGARHAYKRQS